MFAGGGGGGGLSVLEPHAAANPASAIATIESRFITANLPGSSSLDHAVSVHAGGGRPAAGVEEAAHARARAGRQRLTAGERAAVTAGAVVGLEPAVAVALAGAAAGGRLAELLRTTAARRRADPAARVAADRAGR